MPIMSPPYSKPSKPRLSAPSLGSVWRFPCFIYRRADAALMWCWSGMLQLRFWPFWLALLAGGVSLAGLGNDPFWYDESFTVRIVRLDLPHAVAAIAGDVHPPLFYAVEWLMGHLFGYSEFAMRLPSLLFGVGGVAVLYEVVKDFAGEREARLSSFLWAVMPAAINYNQEARGYSLLTFLVLLAVYAARRGNWRLLTGTSAALMLTHNLSVFYLGLIALIALSKSLGRAVKSFAAAAAIYAPWGIVALQQARAVSNAFWIAPQHIGALAYSLLFDTLFTRWPAVLAFSAIIFSSGLSTIALWQVRKDARVIPLVALALFPPAAMFAVSAIWKPIYLDRGLLPSGAAMVALWGIALARLKAPDKLPAALVIAPVMLAGLAGFYGNVTRDYDWTQPARIIRSNWSDCDVIYHANVASLIQIDEYYPGHSVLLPEANDLSQNLTDQTKNASGMIRAPLDDLAGLYCRFWFVYVNTPLISEKEYLFSQHVIASYPILARWDLYSSKLTRFQLYLMRFQ